MKAILMTFQKLHAKISNKERQNKHKNLSIMNK
jgi:hypothetical protein